MKRHAKVMKSSERKATVLQNALRSRNHHMNLAVVSAILNISRLQRCKEHAAEIEQNLLHRMLQSSCLGYCCNAPAV
jgi:hypothetical protein